MRNCRGQDLQAAAKTAQKSFYSARLFNPGVSTKTLSYFSLEFIIQ